MRLVTGDVVDASRLAEILGLLDLAFDGAWPRLELSVPPAAHLQWRLDGPFADSPSHVSTCDQDGRLIYSIVSVRVLVLVRGERRPFVMAGDQCTHPDYQGTGVLTRQKLFGKTAAATGVDGSLSVTRNAVLLGSQVRAGEAMAPTAHPIVLLRVFGAWAMASRRRDSGARRPTAFYATVFSLLKLASTVSSALRRAPSVTWKVEAVSGFDSRYDDLFEDAGRDFRCILVRTSEYLNWRYMDRRGGDFTVFAAQEGEEVLGYAALKVQAGRGYIMDLLVRPGRMDVVRSLLSRAEQFFRDQDVIVVECWMHPKHPYRRLLRRYGFFDARMRTGFWIGVPPGPRGDSLDFLGDDDPKMHVMLGDVDNV